MSEPEKSTLAPPNVAERVAVITEIMARQEWVEGVTIHELAEEWGVGVAGLEKLTAEASRRVEAFADADNVKRLLSYFLRKRLHEVDEIDATDWPKMTIAKAETTAKLAEPYGRVAGVIKSGTQLALQVNLGGMNVDATADELRALVMRSQAFFAERHPELAEEYRAFLMGEAT